MPTDVLTADADKILAEIATPAKRFGGGLGSQASPPGQASPGKLGAGASLADFELMEKLGKGNCGTVHKARRLLCAFTPPYPTAYPLAVAPRGSGR